MPSAKKGEPVIDPQIEDRLEDVRKRIVEAFDPHRIILFGSYAHGKPTPDSDVDLLIKRPMTFWNFTGCTWVRRSVP